MSSVTQIKKEIMSHNWSFLFGKRTQKEDTKIVADIARLVSWSKLWDLAHNEGPLSKSMPCVHLSGSSHIHRTPPEPALYV